ncbi:MULTISPECIES: methyltransferase domain-containing protein [unclassified Colwellia]|uniref:methyltransferase domain-containing protein n=1 Tax=unclassified Colwellia TaxID=196834 RepID=UPI0015F3FCE7|nr:MULTISPECIES: methyltransferase domain-containing protein [unclassified Colwellia]MBA6231621.1 methyltransferase domain-containing protein [Colwellia sp. MB02u-7]MBA6235485.1 methyltransferase domain-containing protein [Colwellia sp. MB02u-11]MBA6258039.1 methyltransferase domain-containing protein [Colwellia sp. MB3u-28]MBA6259733.1 methyltransferase domain-containing protein [Colwellia sp. MB3u-41]MBA6299817.1 methyltransferase domain-containing protein [Colwellia sp. MB3u-22]
MHSLLLNQYLPELKDQISPLPILDLACGNGRNGLFCLEKNLIVTFADINEESLGYVKQTISRDADKYQSTLATFWRVDFEQAFSQPLAEKSYRAVMVFRYLHRPLIEQIKAAVIPNGLVIYETFTLGQAELGRPKNPNFLLKVGELAEHFSDWKIIHYFEGATVSDTGNYNQAIAQVVARKPL